MELDAVLSRLQKVRGRAGSYIACCPAHDDKSPSMTVREADDGKILMHCFAGCSVDAIAGAIGLDLTDLFPPRPDHDDYTQPQRKVSPKFYPSELLKVIGYEATIVSICAYDMAHGREIPPHDLARLQLAADRINEALELSK